VTTAGPAPEPQDRSSKGSLPAHNPELPLTVAQVMTKKLRSVRPDTSFKETALALIQNRLSGVPVVDRQGRLVGIVSESDLLPREALDDDLLASAQTFFEGTFDWDALFKNRKAVALTAGELMTTPVQTATPQTLLRQVAKRLSESGLPVLPVVDHGKLVGMVTRHDVLKVYCASDADTLCNVKDALEHRGYVPPRHCIDASVHEGIVTLGGTTNDPESLRRALALVRAMDGVVAIRNLVRVDSSAG
jgi:CBS domain-containing protein